jgi:large subunit ribosomal protein L22
MKAFLKNYRQSPRKIGMVAALIRGKKVGSALSILQNTTKAATVPLAKLLKSAVASAKERGMNEADLFVRELQVNKGVTLKRSMPRARGSAYQILKRSSHVTLTLGVRPTTDNQSATVIDNKKTK